MGITFDEATACDSTSAPTAASALDSNSACAADSAPASDSAVRWLDDDEMGAWMPLLATIMRLPPALDVQLERDAGISTFEYGVLSALSMAPDRTMKLSELAQLAYCTLARLSKAFNRLAGEGWVERRPDSNDGRTTLGVLTEAGWQKVVASAPGHVERARELVFDHLTRAQVRQLRTIAEKIAAASASRTP